MTVSCFITAQQLTLTNLRQYVDNIRLISNKIEMFAKAFLSFRDLRFGV